LFSRKSKLYYNQLLPFLDRISTELNSGHSNRRTIAPGIFEYNKWNLQQWQEFWSSDAERARKC